MQESIVLREMCSNRDILGGCVFLAMLLFSEETDTHLMTGTTIKVSMQYSLGPIYKIF